MKAKPSHWRLLVAGIVMFAALPLLLQGCGSSNSTDSDSGTERTVTLTGATS